MSKEFPEFSFCRETGVKRRCSRYAKEILLSATIHQLASILTGKNILTRVKDGNTTTVNSLDSTLAVLCAVSLRDVLATSGSIRALVSHRPSVRELGAVVRVVTVRVLISLHKPSSSIATNILQTIWPHASFEWLRLSMGSIRTIAAFSRTRLAGDNPLFADAVVGGRYAGRVGQISD